MFFFLLLLLFLTSNKTDGRVPSQEGAYTTCNLTYWEVSQQTYLQTLLASLVVAKGHNSDLISGRGGGLGKIGVAKRATFSPSVKREGGGGELVRKIHVIYSRHQFPSDTNNHLYPRKTFRPGTCYFFKIFQPAKIGLKNRYFLRNRSIGCPCFSFTCTLH